MTYFDDSGQVVPAVSFDFDAIDARLAGEDQLSSDDTCEPQTPAGPDPEERDLSLELANLQAWLGSPAAVEYFGSAFNHRMLALIWATAPESYGGKSLSALARERGITPAALSKYAAEASRIFGLKNRSQRAHDSRARQRGG